MIYESNGTSKKHCILQEILEQITATVPSRWALKDLAAQEFAAINGWHVSYLFPLRRLGKPRGSAVQWPCDHALAFKQGRRPAAFVTQPYGHDAQKSIAEVRAVADNHGLTLHVPPGGAEWSIYFPGQALFLVMTKPGIEVRWLPEQYTRWIAQETSRDHSVQRAPVASPLTCNRPTWVGAVEA
jgi:hypothetical protein